MINRLYTLRKKSENGFTLIEILVVILVIGILASIAIPVFLNQRKHANDAAVESDARAVAQMAETWMVENPNSPLPYRSGWTHGEISIGEGSQKMTTPLSGGVMMVLRSPDSTPGPGGSTTPPAVLQVGIYEIEGAHQNGKKYSDTTVNDRFYYRSDMGGDNSDKTW